MEGEKTHQSELLELIKQATVEHIATLQRCLKKVQTSGMDSKNLQAYLDMVQTNNQQFTDMEDDGVLP